MKDFILKLARHAIEIYVRSGKVIPRPKSYPKEMDENRGVFVTIYKNHDLRGCIGLPFPEKPLVDGIIEAAVEVTKDPRFPPLAKEELKDIHIEVSVLSEPKAIDAYPDEIKKHIEMGKDGLIIRKGMQGGLFLPQVPIEQGWDMDEYLENLCYKAGMSGDAWKNPNSKIYKFRTEIFSE
jgi:uncharacterized protein (TIGR00296 family)